MRAADESAGLKNKSKEPRRHHYLPQCYLRGFAETREEGAPLHAFDVTEKRWFATIPRHVGYVKDFNRVDDPQHAPSALERALVGIEGEYARVLKAMHESRTMPSEQRDYVFLLNLIAGVAIRNPRMRRKIHGMYAQTERIVSDLLLATKDRYETTIRQMKRDGYPVNESVTYESMKGFHERNEYDLIVSQTAYFKREMAGMDAILPLLYRRKWTVLVAPDTEHQFITSDQPVILLWNGDVSLRTRERTPPGHAHQKTVVIFPVMKELAIIGSFIDPPRSAVVDALRVAKVNTYTLVFAQRQVYASRPSLITAPAGMGV